MGAESMKSSFKKLTQSSKRALFKLMILAEQPLSELSKIQQDYARSGGDVIASYIKLNGIDSLEYAEGAEMSKLIQKYELNKPYYSRKAVGDRPITICNPYLAKCSNRYLV